MIKTFNRTKMYMICQHDRSSRTLQFIMNVGNTDKTFYKQFQRLIRSPIRFCLIFLGGIRGGIDLI